MKTLEEGRALAGKIRKVQLAVFAVLCLASGVVDGLDTLSSILMGGLSVVLPQALFGLYALRSEASDMMIFSRMLQGELVKISSTVILIYLALIHLSIEPLLFFCAYAFGLITSWLTALISTPDHTGTKSA